MAGTRDWRGHEAGASTSAQPMDAKPATGIAPLLARLIDRQAATGLPPPYLPKDEQGDDT